MSETAPGDRQAPRWRQYGRKLFWPVFWVFATGLVIFVIHQSQEFSNCIHEGKKTKDYQSINKRVSVFFDFFEINQRRVNLYSGCVGHFTDKNEGSLTALATIVLGGFTFALWWSTRQLWMTSLRQAKHMKDTAERQLRAYISVEAGGVPNWAQGFNSHAMIYVRNFGQTPAYKVVVAANFDVINSPPDTDIAKTAEISRSGDMHIAPGQLHMVAHEKFFGDCDMADVINE